MELIYESTAEFEKAKDALSKEDRERLIKAVNERGQLFYRKKWHAFRKGLSQPVQFRLKYGAESAFYLLPVGDHLRVLFAADEDPLFEQTRILLVRVVPTEKAKATFEAVVGAYYRDEAMLDESTKTNGRPSQASPRPIRRNSRRRQASTHSGAQARLSRRTR